MDKPITIALMGQPNVGKSTVFNMITGMNQHVGNWPGKTVERKIGTFSYNDCVCSMVDLPGTYSLSANSPEEVIARDFIIKERPDMVVAVVDAAALERNLYLVSELLPLKVPLIIALNMMDVAEREGHHIKPEALEKTIGIKVVPMVAAKNRGVDELMEAINDLAQAREAYNPSLPKIPAVQLGLLNNIQALIGGRVPEDYPRDWVALKLLEGDRIVTQMIKQGLEPGPWKGLENILAENDGAMPALARSRYEWIDRVVKGAVRHPNAGQIGYTARWDRLATHPVWGLVIMLAILAGAVLLAKRTGLKMTWDALDHYLPVAKTGAASLLSQAPPWLVSMVVDGIIPGLGILMVFIVFLTMFFIILGILEDVGYLPRLGYMMHRFMKRIGLHGKSFLPLCVGFSCNVPGIMGTRVIETERARLMTILLTPFIPCMAQTTTAIILAPIFFGSATTLVVVGLVLFNILVLGLSGILLNRVLPKQEHLGLIMELPLYHWPNPRTIAIYVWQRMKHFLAKAGTVIVAATILIWALAYFPHGQGHMETSILSSIGQFFLPLGELMGLNWKMTMVLFTSFISKESTLISMGVLVQDPNFVSALQAMLSTPAALAFLVTNMLFIPCITTFAVIVGESKSLKWAVLCVTYLFIVAFGMGILVYNIAGLVM